MKSIQHLYGKLFQFKREWSFPYCSYNRKGKCIFIHVPKVAGTSVLEAVAGKTAKRNHLPWYVYYTANPSFYSAAFKFSFVRNPWDRVFSAYNYMVDGGNKKTDLVVSEMISKYKDFDDFVINALGEGLFRNHLLFLPQSEFLINGEQGLAVDFVGRYECLKEDFDVVADKLKIDALLSKKNRSVRREDYRSYYKKEESVEIIRNIYRQDVSVFSYEF